VLRAFPALGGTCPFDVMWERKQRWFFFDAGNCKKQSVKLFQYFKSQYAPDTLVRILTPCPSGILSQLTENLKKKRSF
jgi:hypothetical protein